MWIALALWLWRGGDTVATPTDLPAITPARTIHDVEVDLAAARYAQKRGPMRAKACDITLRDVAVNALLDEWAWHNAGAPALDFPVDDRADEAPIVTHIGGGPLDADV